MEEGKASLARCQRALLALKMLAMGKVVQFPWLGTCTGQPRGCRLWKRRNSYLTWHPITRPAMGRPFVKEETQVP